MTPDYAPFFAVNISLLRRLSTWGRVDHSNFLRWITEFLRKPECNVAVSSILNSDDPKTRRQTYQLLARPESEQFESLLRRALTDNDPTIRRWSVTQARLQLKGESLRAVVGLAIGDNYSGVRSQAAYIFAENFLNESKAIMASLVMDSSASLRSIGRYYFGKIDRPDYVSYYVDRLQPQNVGECETAIRGLCEVGRSVDIVHVLPFVHHENAKVRAAAIYALARLDGDLFVSEFTDALFGESPLVSKAAALALSKRVSLVDHERLWNAVRDAESPVKKKRLLALLFECSKWDGLYFAIESLADSELEITALAQAHIERWMQQFNRSSVQPTARQKDRIFTALTIQTGNLKCGAAKSIRFLIGD